MSENEAPTKKTAWQGFWLGVMPADLQLILGTFFVVATLAILGWVALNEGGDNGRMQEFQRSYNGRSIEQGAVIFATSCAVCHGEFGEGSAKAPPLYRADLFDESYLDSIGWTGTLEDFLTLTVAAGRPTSLYDEPMPTGGVEYDGPLRPDQVQDVVNFILNWEEPALAGIPPGSGSGAAEDGGDEEVTPSTVGMDLERELPEGDAANGEALFTSLGCIGCHIPDGAGPDIQGIASRAADRKAELTAVEYIRESIQKPEAYVVEGYTPLMEPFKFGDRITPQELADLIAYLLTLE